MPNLPPELILVSEEVNLGKQAAVGAVCFPSRSLFQQVSALPPAWAEESFASLDLCSMGLSQIASSRARAALVSQHHLLAGY